MNSLVRTHLLKPHADMHLETVYSRTQRDPAAGRVLRCNALQRCLSSRACRYTGGHPTIDEKAHILETVTSKTTIRCPAPEGGDAGASCMSASG